MATASTSQRQQQKVFSYCHSSDFLEVSQSPAFVDKTLFIKTLFESEFNYGAIVAPPGYGKSTILDMFKRFVEIDVDPQTGKVSTFNKSKNYQIFKNNNLKIYQEQQFFKDYFAKFPVIYLSLKNIYAPTVELVMEKYAENLSKSFQQHQYLTQSKQLNGRERQLVATYTTLETCQKLPQYQLQNGLPFLTEMLSKHYVFKEMIVLIDDCDHFIIQHFADGNIANFGDHRKPSEFFSELFDTITKPNDPIVRGLFVNRTKFCNFDYRFHKTIKFYTLPMCQQYFGLMKEEIIDLLIRFDFDSSETIDWIISYYSGSFNSEPISCTLSVMRYLTEREFLDFRDVAEILEIYKMIKQYVVFPTVRHSIDKILAVPYVLESSLISNELAVSEKGLVTHLLIQILRCYSYLSSKEILGSNRIYITNEIARSDLHQLISEYYSDELNQELERCAKIFNQISANAPRSVYFNFVEEYRKIAIKYSNLIASRNLPLIQCMMDIMAKTEFVNSTVVTTNTIPPKICNTYVRDINVDDLFAKTGLCLCVEDQTPVESLLATAVDLLIDYDTDNFEVVSIGISTDTKFRFAIGWVVGKDLKNAQYFSFK